MNETEKPIEVGDTVRFEGVVTHARPSVMRAHNGKTFVEVNGQLVYSDQLTVVKRKPKPRPKVGDVLSAPAIRAVQWKRGSVIKSPSGNIGVLAAAGDWRFSTGRNFTFDDLGGHHAEYTVIYLP